MNTSSSSGHASAAEATLWFDLTSTLHWHRPATGIVRVEQECCRVLLETEAHRLRLCAFDRKAQVFYALTHDEGRVLLNRVWHAPDTTPPETASRAQRPSLEVRAKALARRLLNITPERYRDPLKWKMVALRRIVGHAVREWREVPGVREGSAGADLLETQAAGTRPVVTFAPGDTYLTMGLDWEHDKLRHLYEAKRQHRFTVRSVAYDIIPILFPHLHWAGSDQAFARYFADLAWVADEICCISRRTRQDLVAFYRETGAPVPAMSVIRLGDTLPSVDEQPISETVQALVGTRFVLTVSTLEIRKNHETLYKAWLDLLAEGHDDLPTLVCVGAPGWRVDDLMFSLAHDRRIQGRIVQLNRASDAELSLLYENCLFTVYPSLYEGWGLPVAESLAHGKFCLASNAASIPEVGGDLVEYLHPWDAPGWAARILEYSRNDALRAWREAAIRERYHVTTWASTARAVAGLRAVPASGA